MNTKAQRGVSLVIVMMFLLAITGVTAWSVRKSMFGEGMARNQLDQEVAHQAAESALRDAERDILNLTSSTLVNASCTRSRDRPPQVPDFSSTCTNGFCVLDESVYASSNWTTGAVSEPWWPTGKGGLWNDDFDTKPGRDPVTTTNCNFTGGVPVGTYTGATALPGVAVQPEYLVELFRRTSNVTYQPTNVYRITARGFGYTQRTQVVLQTIFIPLQD
jgi:type IV pilus assembly protein PilX